MTARQHEGAGRGAQDQGAVKWRLETLHRRTEEGVRDLGARILAMYHEGSLDPEAVRAQAAELDELEHSTAELEQALRGETGPSTEESEAVSSQAQLPPLRPVPGAEETPAEGQAAAPAAEPPTNGERDGRMNQAVEAARRQAEGKATTEIMALERDLEQERERAAKALQDVQRRLEEAEARAAGNVNVTDARARREAADWLREQRGDVRRELEAELERRMLAREKKLSADRAEAERRVSDEADEKLREHNEQLQARIRALESETEKRITEAVEKGEGSDETRIELERQIRADFEKELARRIKEIKEEADARAREEVDAARRAAELRFETEFKDREEALRREREASTEAANAAQRRLDEIAEQIEAAGKRVESAEAHLAEEHGRLQRDAAERLDAEMRRLQAESDAKIEEALVKVEADTRSRIEKDAERRLAEQKNALRAEAEERVRITTETVREETETKLREEIRALREKNKADRAGSNELLARAYERAERAEAEAKAAEEVRQGAEAEARSSAAEWVRVQIRSFHGDSEKDAEKRLLQVRREAEQEAERTFAGREQELAAELEEAARALRSAEHQLRDAESRAESAERKLGETSDEHLRRVQVQNETRFQALEERIKSVIDKASGAQAHAASVGIELPGRDELEKPEPDTEEQEAVEGTRGGLLRGRLHRAQAKRRKATAKPRRRGDPVDINKATFEQLREVGMSVTQATRVIAYRERGDGFESVDDLETVPGVTKLLKEIREQLTA